MATQKDEWCWFWTHVYDAPILAKFVKRKRVRNWIGTPLELEDYNGYVASNFKLSSPIGPREDSYIFYRCEPFIGELPTYLKDKNER